jgi:hypothetical protein
MIPGVTALGVYAIGELPSEYDLSEPDSLTLLLAHPDEARVFLLEASPYDPIAVALAAPLLPGITGLANTDYSTGPTDSIASKYFAGRLMNPYNLQTSVFANGRLAARSIPSFGEVKVANPDGAMDRLARYSWAWRSMTFKVGLPTFAYDDFGLIFTGTSEEPTWDWNTITLHPRDLQYLLAKPLQTTFYAGTGGLEGGVELAGKPKPKAYGQVREIEPVAVDPANLVYQYNDGSTQSSNNWKDAGVALTSDGDVADLYATSVVAGHYKTDLAHGLLRLGSEPIGTLTGDVQGDASGSGYVYSAADIIRRILTTAAGLADGDLDLSTFTVANAANSAVNGHYSRLDPIDIDVVIDLLASSIGAFWTYSRAGLFRLIILDEPGMSIATIGLMNDVVQDSMSKPAPVPPAKRLRLGYKKFWTTQTSDALAISVSPADKANYAEEYRYVTAEDTSVATAHLDAEELEQITLLDTEADAQTEADRRFALYSKRREVLRVPLVRSLFTRELGDVVQLGSDFTRYGLAFWKGVVVGLTEDAGDAKTAPSTELEIWGKPALYVVTDDGLFITDDSGNPIVIDG